MRNRTARPVRALRLLLLLALCGVRSAAGDLPAVAAAETDVWLSVDRPYDGWVELGVSPLMIVRGRAGSVGDGFLDLVLLIDSSRSTAESSGVDVNADGHLGGIGFAYRRDLASYLRDPGASSDPADSIFNASFEAVRRLVARLDPVHTRVGVVTFRERATVRSSIGNTPEELLRAIRTVSTGLPAGRTDMAEAIRTALAAFPGLGAPAPVRARASRVIVLLSDGRPTVPDPPATAFDRALEAADEAHRKNVRIYTIALGVPDEEARVLREIARITNGAFAPLDRPGDVLEVLPELELRGLADVQINNLTTRQPARAVRVWGDGTYDGYVRLADGKNQLEVVATARGRELRETRWVYFRRFDPLSARDRSAERRRLLDLRDLLRTRGVRVDVEREVEAAHQKRERAVRGLQIEVVD